MGTLAGPAGAVYQRRVYVSRLALGHSRRPGPARRWLPRLRGFALVLLSALGPSAVPALFEIPGHEKECAQLERLYGAHRVVGPDTTLWDAWVPMSILWCDTTNSPSLHQIRSTYRERLLRRRIDAEGYVSTQQHEGLAHSEGWPFPLHTQAGGVGWLFSVTGVPYGREFGVRPVETVTNWTVVGAVTAGLDPSVGWTLKAEVPGVVLTSPDFKVDTLVAPFLRMKWSAQGLGDGAEAVLEWQMEGETEFRADRRFHVPLPAAGGGLEDVNLALYRHPRWTGRATRLRFVLTGLKPGAELRFQRVFTAIDSRHNVNNALYLQGCDDYLRWTGDLDFLRRNVQRMRLALAWALREFQVAEKEVVTTTWIGHDGRSGHVIHGETGRRTLRPGVGVGNNYWDLLPFGGEDALATIYYFDVLRRMAALERQIARNPAWNIPGGPLQFDPAELVELSETMQEAGNERFWNAETGRFAGWRTADGSLPDYGFTFVNNEAVYFAFAGQAQSRSIREWLDGRRVVAGDTSTGADIYHWRFGPRATTRRNVETYFWGWSDPASIAWGGQVQDGGAVLGFSFHDLMARIEVNGPENAWQRLQEILAWYGEVEAAGGYRKYYSDKSRGTLQGGGTAGGLGLDAEFFESVLVPQVVLQGFLGFRPRLDGCLIAPRLPASWPSLTVRDIRLHDVTVDVTAERGKLRVVTRGTAARPLQLFTPGNEGSRVELRDGVIEVTSRP